MPEPLFIPTGGADAANPAVRIAADNASKTGNGAANGGNGAPQIPAELQNHYLEISRRDADTRKKELALTAREKTLKELEAKYSDLDKLKGDPTKLLERFGMTPDQILLAQLGKKPPTPKVEEQIKAIEERMEADRKAREEEGKTSKAEQERQQIAWFRQNVAREVSAAADKFPLVNALGMHGHIADEMGVYYEKYGEEPTTAQIAEAAEEFVREKLTKAGWTPPRAKQAQGAAPQDQAGKLFDAVSESRPEPKNQDAAARKPFSLQDRVRNVLAAV